MLKNVSLRLKLVMAFMFIAILLVIICVYQIISMQQFTKRTETIVNQDLTRNSLLQDISMSSAALNDRRNSFLQAVSKKSADQPQLKTALLAQSNDLEQRLKAFREATKGQELPASALQIIDTEGVSLITQTRSIANSAQPQQSANQSTIITDQSQLNQAINLITAANNQTIHIKTTELVQSSSDRELFIGILAILFAIIAGIVGIIIASRISRAIDVLGAGAQRIANGDFSQELAATSRDEIGQVSRTFNVMAERLRESYRRLALEQQRDEAILQGMGEGVIAINEDGKIVIINKVAAELLELGNPEDIIQKTILDAYSLYTTDEKNPKSIPAEERPSTRALKTGERIEDVYGFHAKNGVMHQVNIAASPFKLDGKVVGVVTIIRDVTKEKQVDRMKTEFISLASHQLRTPLSAINWYSEMLLNGDAGKLNPDQLEFTRSISESTERMIALVGSLLNISRIESGRIMIVPEPTDLRELIGGIVTDLKAKTEEKEQTLIISVHADLPKISLDPRLIGQVYLNLLTNAIKYTQKGGEISVFVSKKDDMVISQVTDNGYGIPKEQQGRMFQKFFRATNAVKVETDGTGLGLYLIKAVIESSGGKIWFESEEGKGTTFWFTIPLSGMKAKEGEVTLDIQGVHH